MKSMPGTTFCVQNATCSVSAKKLSTLRLSTSLPIGRTGMSSSGISLVASSTSKSKPSANSSSNSCTPSSHSGKLPCSIEVHRSRRWKSGSAPLILTASFHITDCRPSTGFQWNLTYVDAPSALTKRKLWTPKPSMKRNDRGTARSDMTHMIMCIDSGISETKSQKLSCADWAWGKSRSGSGFTACTMSGNLIASWMKNTGMLLPTRSQLPALVYSFTAKPRTSRARSAEPLLPATVEKRTNTSVCSPGRWNRSADVTSASDS